MSHRFDINDARAARDARNHELDRIEEGKLDLVGALREPPEALKRAELYRVLLAPKGMGKESVRTICERARIWPLTELGALTKRERADIIRILPERIK